MAMSHGVAGFVFSTAMVFAGISFVPLDSEAGPRIEVVGADSIDFGKYPASQTKTARHTVRNAGDEPLKIVKVRKTCGCATATASRDEIPPGQTATIETVILANSIFGAYDKSTYVESSDPSRRFTRLVVKGHAVPLVEIKPSSTVHAGRLPLNREWTHTFLLSTNLPNVELGAPVVESTHACDVDLAPSQTTNVSFLLMLRLRPASSPGEWACRIEVPVLSPPGETSLLVRATAKIGNELTAVPASFDLARSEAQTGKRFRLTLQSEEGLALAPELLAWPETAGLSFEPEERHEGSKHLWARATMSPEFIEGLTNGQKRDVTIGYSSAAPAAVSFRLRE